MVEILKTWPRNWSFGAEDRLFGEGLAEAMKLFVEHLETKGYAKRALDRHLNHLFLLGGAGRMPAVRWPAGHEVRAKLNPAVRREHVLPKMRK